MVNLRRGLRGFSILELLVVAVVFGGILIFTSLLFVQGRDAVKLSTDKVDTSGRVRRSIDSLTPLVASAVETGGFEAIEVSDSTPEVLTDACHFDITTTEDFLNPSYSPTAEFNVLGPYYRFRVSYLPDSGELLLHQLTLAPTAIDESVTPRILARNVLGCRLEKLTVASVAITLETRAEQPDPSRPGGVTKSVLNAVLIAPGSRT